MDLNELFQPSRAMTRIGIIAGIALSSAAAAMAQGVPSDSDWAEHAVLESATVPRLRFVELKSAPLAETGFTGASADTYRKKLRQEQADFIAAARARGIGFAQRRSYERLFNGLAIEVDDAFLAAIEAIPGVSAMHAVHQFSGGGASAAVAPPPALARANVTVSTLTGVPEAHAAGIRGAGTTVCVIDGGIDYNHPALGGPGFPNAKVIGGWDFADNDADPFDDRDGQVAGHGTHVSGIAVGSDAVMVGVAPEAKLRFYRVFGTANYGGTEDVIVAAMERAAEDGCDVANMSLGSNRVQVYQQGVLARATDNLLKAGVVPVVAMGNAGTAGPFLPGSPAVAKNAIAVAAAYNTRVAELALRLAGGSVVPYRTIYTGMPAPGSGSHPVVDFGLANCLPVPAGVRYDGQVVVVRQGTFSCRPHIQINLLAGAGAAGVIWWQNTAQATSFPNTQSSTTVALKIPGVVVRRTDVAAILASGMVEWGHYSELVFPIYPGQTTFFSSWGPSYELDFKPDVMAPGGFIFSTLPLHGGIYGVMDGTSMASPHVAGMVALILSANPQLKGRRVHEVRELLLNTAVPARLTSTTQMPGLHPAAEQGAGLVDAMAAIAYAGKATPAKLALGDLRGRPVTRSITVENKSGAAQTYVLTHVPAVSAAPPMTSFWKPLDTAATVGLSQRELVVPAGGKASFDATFTEPAGVPGGTVLSGWIELAPRTGGKAMRVAYIGLKGAYQELPAINPSFTALNPSLDNPALRPESRPTCSGPPPSQPGCCFDPRPMSCGWSIGKNAPVTLNFTNTDKYDDAATVMISQGFPMLRKYRARVLDAGGRTVAYAHDRFTGGQLIDALPYVVRGSGAGTGTDFAEWYGKLADGSPAPSGTYFIRLEFDKLLGTGSTAPSFETWTSPPITVIRP